MKFPLRLALSILLIALLFTYFVDAREVVQMLRDFAPGWLLLAFLMVTLDRVLMAYKWTVLLKAQGAHLPLWKAVCIYCTSMVWGLALPTTVGADAIRAVMVTRRGFNGAEVASSIVIERMVGFVLALALGIVCLVILRSLGILDAAFDKAVWLGVAMLFGAVGLLVLSMNENVTTAAAARLPRRMRDSKVMQYLTLFASAYRSLGAERGAIARFSALTTIEQLFCVMVPWALAKGLGVPVDLLVLLGVLPLSTLISRLPVSFDGIGVFEFVFVGLLLLAGISAEAALAIALSGRIVSLLAFLPWALVYSFGRDAVALPPARPLKSSRTL